MIPRPSVQASALLGAILAFSVLLPSPAQAQSEHFGRLSLGISGGFQTWQLSGLENTLSDRAAFYNAEGYSLTDPSFGWTYSFGGEFELRLTRHWYLRLALEWTRLRFEDRDRSSLLVLGAPEPSAVSLTFESRPETNPLFMILGLQWAKEYSTLRLAFSGNGVVAPVKLTDTVETFLESAGTTSEIESTGIGLGFEGDVTCDYLTETRMTLFATGFFRIGATTVKLDNSAWDSTNFPNERRIDFTGIGLRLGLRFI